MKKVKLYWKVSGNNGIEGLIAQFDELKIHIQADMDGANEEDLNDYEYCLTPKWLTDEEVENMPEYQF